MKAIIIAAGVGKRMLPLTSALPKCMLDFAGKTLLTRHIETLKSCGIEDISLIKGYLGEKIIYPGLKYFYNDRFEHNNILNSLLYAESQITGDVIISYSDIYYEKHVLERLIESRHDISIVVDSAWHLAYSARKTHPVSEAEKVAISTAGFVVDIGKNITLNGEQDGEFIGMMKLSEKGSKVFREAAATAKKDYWGKSFHEARVFEEAYLTDMVQELVDNRIPVFCVSIQGGWKEIDTLEDYENAKKALAAA